MNTAVALLVLLLFAILLMSRIHIAVALGLSGVVGILILGGTGSVASTVGRLTYSTVADLSLVVIPLFILMGGIASNADIAKDAFNLLSRFGQKAKASVPIATVAATAAFSAVTGSSAGTIGALGKSTSHEMMTHGFRRQFAAGIIAVAGTLGVLIPPSMILILYGVITGESIGSLFIAGIVPGLLSAVAYAVTTVVLVRVSPRLTLDPEHSEATSETPKSTRRVGPGAKAALGVRKPRKELIGAAGAAMLFSIVIGGVFFGFFTVTESAAIGALAATVFLFARNFRNPMEAGKRYMNAAKDATSTTGMIFAIMIGAAIFTYFLNLAGVGQMFSSWVDSLTLPPALIVVLILLVFLPLGAILDGYSVMLILVPLAYPVVVNDLGFDGIWFGILVVLMLEIGFVTPPVGLNAFITAAVVPGTTIEEVFKGIAPFLITMAIIVASIFMVPELATGLPELMAD